MAAIEGSGATTFLDGSDKSDSAALTESSTIRIADAVAAIVLAGQATFADTIFRSGISVAAAVVVRQFRTGRTGITRSFRVTLARVLEKRRTGRAHCILIAWSRTRHHTTNSVVGVAEGGSTRSGIDRTDGTGTGAHVDRLRLAAEEVSIDANIRRDGSAASSSDDRCAVCPVGVGTMIDVLALDCGLLQGDRPFEGWVPRNVVQGSRLVVTLERHPMVNAEEREGKSSVLRGRPVVLVGHSQSEQIASHPRVLLSRGDCNGVARRERIRDCKTP
jgi:hypothetical protein